MAIVCVIIAMCVCGGGGGGVNKITVHVLNNYRATNFNLFSAKLALKLHSHP